MRIALVLLAVAFVLWLFAILFMFRVVNIFDAYLMKFPGPWITLGAMAVCPLLAVILGFKMFRRNQARVVGFVCTGGGGLLLVLFIIVLGIPMLLAFFSPETPKNPGVPRPLTSLSGLPVFPGAEGFGTDTPAGRGGRVIEVTTLANDGPGSLRAALNVPEPRIIVFHVGGTIELDGQLFITHPFVTIAGQTAPGGGICLKNAGLIILTHDVLIQHIRIRPGNEGKVQPDTNDAVEILGKHGDADGAHRVVLDHISASWSEDETISTWYGAHDVTISFSIISEALNRSRHHKKTHSAGLLIGDSSYNVSVHHCLMAHNDFRNPLIIEGGAHDIVNNLVYDWGVLGAEVVDYDSNSFLNFVGNFFLPGPSTKTGSYEILIETERGTPKIYVKDNIGPRRSDPSVSDWNVVKYGWDSEQNAPETYRSPDRFAAPPVTTFEANEAFEKILAFAGATLPVRDSVDERVISDVKNKTGRIIDSPTDVGGYPHLARGAAPRDSDHDGMPDDWERQEGFDLNDPTDASGDRDSDGYTNIEEYLHSLSLKFSGETGSLPSTSGICGPSISVQQSLFTRGMWRVEKS